jgi:hypothetical protein
MNRAAAIRETQRFPAPGSSDSALRNYAEAARRGGFVQGSADLLR